MGGRPGGGTHLRVRAALLSDLQRGVVGSAGHGIPGVCPVGGPQHKQIVAGRPEQEVIGLGILQCLNKSWK